ncbi:MAG: DUF533 domain-containing protein [Polyangiaceae bacterium]|jgi:uncharacterized membrane protein YebE (DUF533 family)
MSETRETVGARWNKDVFVALAAIGWADGKLDPDEADAIVRAAVDAGLELEEIAAIEAATQKPVALGTIDKSGLSKDDRLFVYAIACWIARLDGKVTDEESGTLADLAEKLEVPERRRAHAEKRAAEVAALPEGDRPDRYDLAKLRAVLST